MSRDIHDQHSSEAAEAWAMQNFQSAMTALIEQVGFKNYNHFQRYLEYTGMAAFAKNQTKLEGMANEEI